MKITRRKFLGAASAAAATLLSLKGTVLGQSVMASGDALAALNFESFLPFVHTQFIFKGKGGMDDAVLELVDLRDSRALGSRARKVGQENFLMKFETRSSRPLVSDTYIVEHFRLGTFNLFITDGAHDVKTRSYFAVINRVLS